MELLHLGALLDQQRAGARPYLEFLRRESMSLGLYVLPAGGADGQSPHREDEVYVVLAGRGTVTVGREDQPVQPGNVIFVGKHLEHRFHSVEEELQLLVFFAPAESD
jgi:mannose-6-phosphate isomerase-like protein (cupin superfamily)